MTTLEPNSLFDDSQERPADIMITNESTGLSLAVDVSLISPHVITKSIQRLEVRLLLDRRFKLISMELVMLIRVWSVPQLLWSIMVVLTQMWKVCL